jgi:glycosyltransferase involved in cell wall biosynthesis
VKICLVIETGGGGAGRHVIDLARHFASRGHAVTVIFSPVRAEAGFLEQLQTLPVTLAAVEMHRAPGLHDFGAVRSLAAAIARYGPFDIVHGHSSKAGALVRLASVGKAKRVYTPHAFRGLDPQASFATRWIYNCAEIVLGGLRTDALIAVSSDELAFAQRLKIAPGRLHLIRNGVIEPVVIDRDAVRRTIGVAADQILLGFVGRLSYQKAPERFVEVAARAMASTPKLRAFIIGDGENAADVELAIAGSGYGDRFIWKRGVNAQDYIGAFDVLMMTSRYEGLSYVMLESMAAHVPIISTSVAGAHDVIENGRSGIIVEESEPLDALLGALMPLITDKARRGAMAKQAGQQSALLNGSRIIDETEALYQKLVSPAL